MEGALGACILDAERISADMSEVVAEEKSQLEET